MKVGFQDFSLNVPNKDRYECGVDYLWHDFDLGFEDAFYLIRQLKTDRSSVVIFAPSAVVDFYLFDNMLCVQIDGDGLWSGSGIDLQTAAEILKITYQGCEDFGSQIPNTNREWECYPSWANQAV